MMPAPPSRKCQLRRIVLAQHEQLIPPDNAGDDVSNVSSSSATATISFRVGFNTASTFYRTAAFVEWPQ
jgi:hypothetical protein